jgi:hypothetical protein
MGIVATSLTDRKLANAGTAQGLSSGTRRGHLDVALYHHRQDQCQPHHFVGTAEDREAAGPGNTLHGGGLWAIRIRMKMHSKRNTIASSATGQASILDSVTHSIATPTAIRATPNTRPMIVKV